MTHYDHLIIGGGMTADAAVRAIRERDAGGSIGIISAEPHPPYARPPLTKGLWKGDPPDGIWRGTDAVEGVTLHLGRTVAGIDARAHRVTDGSGTEYGYGRLLLATGGRARRLPFGGDDVIAFRTFDDYRRLRAVAAPGARVVVLGGGFIGSELAAALTGVGVRVSMVFPPATIGARIFPADLARAVTDVYRERGVEIVSDDVPTSVERAGARVVVTTRGGRTLHTDAVVAGLGMEPNVALAETAGLVCDDGIVVDAHLRTSAPDVFAAGDVARFFSPALGRRMRVEHEDAALTMGRAAGLAMAGDTAPYEHLPFFYSDLFDAGYEAVGDVDARLETVAQWTHPYREGIVSYLRDGKVVGVLLWNVWGRVDRARELIQTADPAAQDELRTALVA